MTPRDEAWAAELAAADHALLWHPYAAMPNRSPVYPVVAADGVRLTLADGRQVIDGMSSWWAAIHGYNHPALNAALTDQLGRMAHVMFGGLTHPAAIGLAQRLVDLTPAGLECVFFSDSGSVAVEVAMKMAMQCWAGRGRPAKQRFLTPRRGYHGDTFGAMSVCDPVTGMHHLFADALPRQLFSDAPEPGFGEQVDDHHLASVRTLLAAHADEIAAVILEPIVQGTGGMRFYAPDYLRRVRDLCDEHDALLIADEIATGFGRTGELFGCNHAAVSPDILCVGKSLTGGYVSMAATLATGAVAESVSTAEPGALMHGPTFMANPLAASVATASIDLLLASDWRVDIARIERALRAGLEPARDVQGVADVRVLGAIGVIETHEPVNVDDIQVRLLERGVWLRPFGRLLYTMPPYITGDDDLAQLTDAMVAVSSNQ